MPGGYRESALSARARQPVLRVLFQCDSHQLAARPDSGLVKELLQHGLHRTLRDRQLSSDLLIRKAFKHSFEHSPLARGQVARSRPDVADRGCCGDHGSGNAAVQPHLPLHHLSNRLDQPARRAVLEEDSRRPAMQRPKDCGVVHPRRHQQHASGETLLRRLHQKPRAVFFAQIVVQQREIEGRQVGDGKRRRRRSAASRDLKVRLGLQQPA